MDWEPLYKMQEELDQYIVKHHQLNHSSLLEDKILALLVELGELANETRCFKFWSTKEPSSKEVILEEYVDGLHFILSLGLDTGYRYSSGEIYAYSQATQGFLNMYKRVERFRDQPNQSNYQQLFQGYLSLGVTLGFSREDVKTAYRDKNKVNFQRQDEGY